jgi:hypothetical protein
MNRQPTTPPCPGCGAFARIFKDGQSQCAYCGSTLPPLPFTHPGGHFPPVSPLRIGMKARIMGKEYAAIGRLLYEQNEEGEVYRWEEWVLLSQDGEARYLEFDEGKWTLSEAFHPGEAPSFAELAPATKGRSYRIGGMTANVSDAGTCRIYGVEGEVPWPVNPGQFLRFVDFEGGGGFFSAELDEREYEVEWYRGRRMGESAVFEMFGLKQEAQAAEARAATQKDRRSFGCMLVILALVAFIGGCGSGMGAKQVGQGQAVVSQIPDEGQRFGPYSLTKVGRVHRLTVGTNLTQTSCWVQAVVEDDSGELLDTEREFWDESGVDSDGAWHESDLRARREFRLTKSGSYYVRLFADPEAAATNAVVQFSLEEGVLFPTYLIVFGVFSLVIGGLFMLAGAPDTRQKIWEAMDD